MALEGAGCLSEEGKTVIVGTIGGALGVMGIMVAQILHARAVAVILCIFFNPELFENMPRDKIGSGVETVVFLKLILNCLVALMPTSAASMRV